MDLQEKLAKLTEFDNRAEISRKAGLPANTISNILNTKSRPRVDTALAIAKKLDVDMQWLCDPDQGWLPSCRLLDRQTSEYFQSCFVSKYGREASTALAMKILCDLWRAGDYFSHLSSDKQIQLREIAARTLLSVVTSSADTETSELNQQRVKDAHRLWRFYKHKTLVADVLHARQPYGPLVGSLLKENAILEEMNDALREQLEEEGIEPTV